MNTIAFCSELFSERAVELTEIPIAITGSWVKDGRRFSITDEDLDNIVRNFQKRGTGEIVVDYEHGSERPEIAHGGPVPASGWIHTLEIRAGENDGATLWADIDFTDEAQKLIKAKKYRYFSPAIDWGSADKKTGRSTGAKLTSGALTNHPFLEELPAIQLSEKAGKVVDRMLLPVVDKRNTLTDISLDQRRAAVNDAIQSEYGGKVSSPLGCSPSSCLWVKEMFDNYAIIEQDGKLWKFSYTMDSKGNVELGEPEQVTVEYVAAAELSERHGTTFADSGAVTKAEGDGDHPSSHYLVVEDPKKPSTWHLRVKDANGENDHRLMGGAWAALHEGYRGNKYEGPKKQEAISKLTALYKSEKMDTPDQQKGSERFAALPSGQKRDAVSRAIARHSHEVFGHFPWVETMADDHVVVKHDGHLYRVDYAIGPDGNVVVAAPQKKFKPKVRQASELKKKEETAMSDNGMQQREREVSRDISDGEEREYHRNGLRPDRGGRAEAERRAVKIDEPSDDDKTEELADQEERGQDPADSPNRMKVPGSDATVPRLRVRRMRSAGHHAVVDADGKIAGFISHDDLTSAAREAGNGQGEATKQVMAQTEDALKRNPKQTYSQALQSVLLSDDDLRSRYREEHSVLL